MKKVITAIALLFVTFVSFPCTNLLVGKKASTDGSTLISYAADSYALYGELYHWPARQYSP
ncbi:MAG: C69 family dipeptidase, partial [Proteiniphilum sp.]|nr:C69 family dipeptidase [Proteiniphilum sp.]